MNGALWTAKTGLDAQQTRMSVISNNLANVNTTGFKRDRAVFESLLYQNLRAAGTQSSQDTVVPTGLNVGTGVRVAATEKLFTQGNLTATGNQLDMAIQGRGFFSVAMPDGSVGYTRDGSFQQDSQGQLVNANGYLLQPAITVPANTTSLTIGQDGTVTATLENSPAPTQLGTIQISDFVNPSGLKARGGNLYTETASSGGALPGTAGLGGLGTIIQGSVETSNVNIVEELVGMIETQRAYEINSKAISTIDGMLQYANNNM
ncbi:MAG: flagellar basal-body rod protein FlgG [Gammaproteobacteria bacterium]|nr:flagellar basal-body rod protein FlgG [Gammaproteobacteria bacterium]